MIKPLKYGFLVLLYINSAHAHDPIFGLGPHVLFKEGIETSLELDNDKSKDEKSFSAALELTYGITGDWAAGIDIPYTSKQDNGVSSQGFADTSFFTKYRFWRNDSLGLQESAAIALKIKTNSGNPGKTPSLSSSTTDSILGLTYGYEGRKNYRWASIRYRNNGTTSAGFHRGNVALIDLVAGIRPTLTTYLEPDTVWMIELNSELIDSANSNGNSVVNTGGNQIFVSPGIFWTTRNFAIKAGVQLPVYQKLNGVQTKDEYRIKTVFEWHF